MRVPATAFFGVSGGAGRMNLRSPMSMVRSWGMISHLDHLVLTVRSIPRSIDFYVRVLGMSEVSFAGGRKALSFGLQKINLHESGREFEPKAQVPTPGSADLCFITKMPILEVMGHLKRSGVAVLEGPVPRTGACGTIVSVYFRDPDGNLIEVSNEQ